MGASASIRCALEGSFAGSSFAYVQNGDRQFSRILEGRGADQRVQAPRDIGLALLAHALDRTLDITGDQRFRRAARGLDALE